MTPTWQTSCITSVGHNFMFFQYDEMHLAGLLIGLDKKSEIMPQFRGRLYYKIGLLCDKLCDFFGANLHCFTRFQRRKTTLMLSNRQFECKGMIKHLL